MTNVYRTLAATHGAAHLRAPHGAAGRAIAVVTLLIVAVCVAAGLTLSLHRQSIANEQTVAEARAILTPGMSRADCYEWLRAHHLIATNVAFAAWKRNALGVWLRSDDGAWPQSADVRLAATPVRARALANPDIEVRLTPGLGIGCGMTIVDEISFDRFDRIVHVTPSAPYWSCR
jgi:hypothetical protein